MLLGSVNYQSFLYAKDRISHLLIVAKRVSQIRVESCSTLPDVHKYMEDFASQQPQ